MRWRLVGQALAVGGASVSPWLLALAAALLFRSLWHAATLELTQDEAVALLSIWERRGSHVNNRTESALWDCANVHLMRWGFRSLTKRF
jgi:hypothetical protein